MQKVLLAALVFALHSFIFGSFLQSGEVRVEPQKLKYEYKIETDLTIDKFSDAFCKRLSTKHKWRKLETTVSADETYTSTFNFKDDNQIPWECEITIQRDREDKRKMDVLMTMSPKLES
ncbi:MAG: hypothetical protein ABI543_07685 [Ignavibacteria bacterium]